MAESYSVRAILSAEDRGFSKAFSSAGSVTQRFDKTLSGLTFGVLTGAGMAAFNAVSSGVTGIIGDLNDASATWKTFEGNMSMNGKSAKQIATTRKSLQKFATQTIYSSSDMATTYAQLDAVGTKHTTKLVKGFGGLAAAAENPQQAMKTLSQQATQMAAKPTVQWQDFKLMLEQTPAGISAVAKSMGKSTKQLVKDVQDGEVKTEDFFDAIQKVGTNKAFTKLATQYKTAGQAMDGLKETATNKLQPAFNKLSQYGISAISAITDKIDGLNGKAIAKKLGGFIEDASLYWEAGKSAFSGTGGAIGDAVSAVMDSLSELNGGFGSFESVESFQNTMETAANAIKKFAKFVEKHSDTIAKVIDLLPKLLAGYMAFKAVSCVAGGVKKFGSGLGKVAKFVVGNTAGRLSDTATATESVGRSAGKSSKKILATAKAFMMMGAGVLMISAGFALLAQSAIALANAGPLAIGVMAGLVGALLLVGAGVTLMLNSIKPGPAKLKAISTAMLAMGVAVVLVAAGFAIMAATSIALANAGPLAIGVMVGMVAALALLAVGAAALGPALTAGAVGFVAFGAAMVLVGVGAVLAAAALYIISGVLPQITTYGTSGAVAIAALGASMIVFGVGAAIAGAGAIILGAGLIVAGAGMIVLGAGAIVAGAGLIVFGAALMLLAPAFTTVTDGVTSVIDAISGGLTSVLDAVAGVFDSIGNAALNAGAGFLMLVNGIQMIVALPLLDMATSLAAVATGVGAIALAGGNIAPVGAGMQQIATAILIIPSATSTAQAGMIAMAGTAQSSSKMTVAAFVVAVPLVAKSASLMMKQYNRAIKTGMNSARTTARSMSIQVGTSMRSGYSAAYSSGAYLSIGFANGMKSELSTIQNAADKMVTAANAAVVAKAKIGSPSKVAYQFGAWYGEGFVNGIDSMERQVYKASENMIMLPNARVSTPMSYNGSLSEQSEYGANYVIVVPVELDGREVARVTAPYTEAELSKRKTRRNRKLGMA